MEMIGQSQQIYLQMILTGNLGRIVITATNNVIINQHQEVAKQVHKVEREVIIEAKYLQNFVLIFYNQHYYETLPRMADTI